MADRHADLYQTLRDRICLLDYPPATRLSEAELAEEFGTSRTPLRRVLARLEDEGLVRSQHGVGTFVTDVDMAEMAEIYALREELAELAGTLSPLRPTPDQMTTLDGYLAQAEALCTAPDSRSYARLNMDAFALGLSLSGNAALRETSERLYFRTARVWLNRVDLLDLREEIAIFCHELSETRRALAIGDLRAAALIRRAHISMCRQRLLAAAEAEKQDSPLRQAM